MSSLLCPASHRAGRDRSRTLRLALALSFSQPCVTSSTGSRGPGRFSLSESAWHGMAWHRIAPTITAGLASKNGNRHPHFSPPSSPPSLSTPSTTRPNPDSTNGDKILPVVKTPGPKLERTCPSRNHSVAARTVPVRPSCAAPIHRNRQSRPQPYTVAAIIHPLVSSAAGTIISHHRPNLPTPHPIPSLRFPLSSPGRRQIYFLPSPGSLVSLGNWYGVPRRSFPRSRVDTSMPASPLADTPPHHHDRPRRPPQSSPQAPLLLVALPLFPPLSHSPRLLCSSSFSLRCAAAARRASSTHTP